MLFSEPKIPQFCRRLRRGRTCLTSFSALQRAENSSMCDSAALIEHQARFSALQRAENSSMQRIVDINNTRTVSVLFSEPKIPQSINVTGNLTKPKTFQCSSASRKFLNRRWPVDRFFARCVSVLFSEPKIPQSVPGRSAGRATRRFSALQRAENSSITTSAVLWTPPPCFSALQRAENSSIRRRRPDSRNAPQFQCSSASRKFLNPGCLGHVGGLL